MRKSGLRFQYRGRVVGAYVAPQRATRPGRPPWVVTIPGVGTYFGPPCRAGEPRPVRAGVVCETQIRTWIPTRLAHRNTAELRGLRRQS